MHRVTLKLLFQHSRRLHVLPISHVIRQLQSIEECPVLPEFSRSDLAFMAMYIVVFCSLPCQTLTAGPESSNCLTTTAGWAGGRKFRTLLPEPKWQHEGTCVLSARPPFPHYCSPSVVNSTVPVHTTTLGIHICFWHKWVTGVVRIAPETAAPSCSST